MAEEEHAGAGGAPVEEEDFLPTRSDINLKCRMYENKFPDVEELVTVQVTRIEEMGAYVTLLEYNDVEGMILLSELSRRRIRSINKLIRVGRQEIVMTLRVDPEKGYIDLSKRRVDPDGIAMQEEKYNKSKSVHSIMRHVAHMCSVDVEKLYEQFAWPLYKKYGHAYDAFKLAVTEPEKVFAEYNIAADVMDVLIKQIRRRLTPQPVKIRADFELTCFAYEGVDAIKASLIKAIGFSTDDAELKVKLVAPPLYVMSTMSVEKEKGIAVMNQAMDSIKESITAAKGELVVQAAARAVGEREDKALAQLLSQLEVQNKEVSGDDEEGDEDDE